MPEGGESLVEGYGEQLELASLKKGPFDVTLTILLEQHGYGNNDRK